MTHSKQHSITLNDVSRTTSFEIHKSGARWSRLSDPYHLILTLSWPRFIGMLVGFFIVANLVFACIYWLVDGSVNHARPGSFLDLFFFSIETFATVGYGEMAPATTAGHLIASVEIVIGMMSLAVFTGHIFARFSKPTARVLFSNKIVIRDFDGHRVLMLRAANERHNKIVEPSAHLGLIRLETTKDGDTLYAVHDLTLVRNRNPVFTLSWTLIHRINESSPLHGLTAETIGNSIVNIHVSISGHDETVAAPVYALYDYHPHEVVFDCKFVDIIVDKGGGNRMTDLTKFHDIVPL